MEPLSSGSSEIFPWLVNLTENISIMICFIFLIRFIAAGRLPAWCNYCLWLILLVPMLFPWQINNRVDTKNVMPVSVEYKIFGSTLIDDQGSSSGVAGDTHSQPRKKFTFQIDKTIPYIWFLGVMVLGMFILVKIIRIFIKMNKRKILNNERIAQLLEECRERMNIRRKVEIVVGEKGQSPALFGYFHPRLILPEDVCKNSRDEALTYIFMHEMAHLKRHDIGVAYLMTLLQVIHWFNPLVWIAFYQMRIDQEAACDSLVLSHLSKHQPVEYANAIIGFLGRYCRKQHVPSMACILESKKQMKKRLSMIVNYRGYSGRMKVTAVSMLVVTGLVLISITGLKKQVHDETGWSPVTQEIIDSAYESLKKNKINGAENIFTDTAGDKSLISDILFMVLGKEYSCQRRQLNNAGNILEQGYKIDPENDEIKRCLMKCNAQLAFENREYIESGFLYEKIYESYPDNRNALALSAAGYFYGGNRNEAIRIYRRMADLNDPANVMWLETLIKTSEMLGLADESRYREQLKEIGICSDLLKLCDNGEVYTLSEVDDPPKVIKGTQPQYPVGALKQDMQSEVLVRFIITKEGIVRDAEFVEASPEDICDNSALTAVSLSMFKPATKNGKAVDVIVTSPLEYVHCQL